MPQFGYNSCAIFFFHRFVLSKHIYYAFKTHMKHVYFTMDENP